MPSTPNVRFALPTDASTILQFIQELAEYEREAQAVETSAAVLAEQMGSDRPPFEAWVVEVDGASVGFMLAFQTYSTWKGRPGLWLEDFYVTPAARGQGAGAALFAHLGKVCAERGYGRLELSALDWNQLAIDFYKKRGAAAMSEWTTWRFEGPTLEALG